MVNQALEFARHLIACCVLSSSLLMGTPVRDSLWIVSERG